MLVGDYGVDSIIHIEPSQVHTCGQPLSLGIRFRADHEHSQQRMRFTFTCRRFKPPFVITHHTVTAICADEVRERKPQTELCGERTAVIRRSEQPHFRRCRSHRLRFYFCKRMTGRHRIVKVRDEVLHMLREIVGARITTFAHCQRGGLIAAGRPSYSQINTLREQRLEHAELFGDL